MFPGPESAGGAGPQDRATPPAASRLARCLVLCACFLTLAAGCSAPAGGRDAGEGDAGGRDAGEGDAGGRDAGQDDAGLPVPDGALTLYDFEIRDAAANQIFFRSTVPFTGTTEAGFVVPDDRSSNTPSGVAHYVNAITGVTVNPGALEGHFFTLDHAYVYGDNVLIKYDGGSDLRDLRGRALRVFTHRRVINRVAEPPYTGEVYHVDAATGDDAATGLDPTRAWRSISKAAQMARPGDVVYIKAGNYGAEHVVFARSGTAQDRIRYEGYTSVPGDAPDLGWAYGVQGLDSTVMPLLDGGDRGSGHALDLFTNENRYLTLRNLQITSYAQGVRGRNNAYLIIDNVIVSKMGLVGYSGHGFTFTGIVYNNTFSRCVVENATATAYRIYGYFNALTDSMAYCDEAEGAAGGSQEPTDYYTSFRGDWNYLGGVHLERVGDLKHGGHGITFKGDRDMGSQIGSVANNLAENSTVIHINGSVELRHRMVQRNTIRKISIDANPAYATGRTGGIDLRDGASRNVVEDCVVNGVKNGLSFFDGGEDQGAQFLARDNIIRNSIFSNLSQSAIRMDAYNPATDDLTGNQILYNVIYNTRTLFAGLPAGDISGNVFAGNIVSGVTLMGPGEGVFEQRSNDYFDGIAAPAGGANLELDPLFVDAAGGDFHLRAASPCVDVGVASPDVLEDAAGVARPQGAAYELGVFEVVP